ncbi:Uncharacterised protein [Shigella sonnei]|nr:Uncharacterised protein [Shigella sonnei]
MEAFRFHLIQTAIYSVKLVGWQQDLKALLKGMSNTLAEVDLRTGPVPI